MADTLVTYFEGHGDTWQDQHTSDSALHSIQDLKLHLRGELKGILGRLSVKSLSQSPSGSAGTICKAVHECSRRKESKTLKESWLLLLLQAVRHLGCFRNIFSSSSKVLLLPPLGHPPFYSVCAHQTRAEIFEWRRLVKGPCLHTHKGLFVTWGLDIGFASSQRDFRRQDQARRVQAIFFKVPFMCVYIWVYVCECRWFQRPKEGIVSPELDLEAVVMGTKFSSSSRRVHTLHVWAITAPQGRGVLYEKPFTTLAFLVSNCLFKHISWTLI